MSSGYRFMTGSDTFNFSGGVIPNYYGETLIEALNSVQSTDELRAYNLDRLKGTDNLPLVPTQLAAVSKSVNVKHGFGLGAFHNNDLDEPFLLKNNRDIIRPTNIHIKFPNAPEAHFDIDDNITLLTHNQENIVNPRVLDDRWFEHRSVKYTSLDLDASALMTGMPTFRDKREAASGLEFCRVVQNNFDQGMSSYTQSNLIRIGCLWADARKGTSYVRFFTKMWLDFFSCSAMSHIDTVMSDLAADTAPQAFICNKGPVNEAGHGGEEQIFGSISDVMNGDTFILDMTNTGSDHLKNIAYTYAGQWPRRRYSRRNHHERPIAMNVQLSGSAKLCVHIGARALPNPINFTYLAHRTGNAVLDDIRMFCAHVNGVDDAMIALEIASLLAFGTANHRDSSLMMERAVGDDADRYCISRLGLYKDEILLPTDATSAEYFRPMCKPLDKTKSMTLFMSRPTNVILNYALYFATSQSLALTWALTATSTPAGCFTFPRLAGAAHHCQNIMYKAHANDYSPLHTVWINASALMFGMRPHKITILTLDFNTLVEANNGDRTALRFHRKHAIPINTMWFTMYKYMFCMPDFLALPNENTVVKWPKNKPLPVASSRGHDNDFRLGATLTLVEERPWLGDGGAGYSAQFYASISADGVIREHPTGMTFVAWNKPHQYELPTNTTNIVVRRLPGILSPFLIPGQFNGYNHTARFTRAFGVHYDAGNSLIQSIAQQNKGSSVYIRVRPGNIVNRETDDVIYALIDYINTETQEQTYDLISVTDAPVLSGNRMIRETISNDAVMGDAAYANDVAPNEPSRSENKQLNMEHSNKRDFKNAPSNAREVRNAAVMQKNNNVVHRNVGATTTDAPRYVIDYQKNKVRSYMNTEALNNMKRDIKRAKISVAENGGIKIKKTNTNDHRNDKNIFKNNVMDDKRQKLKQEEKLLNELINANKLAQFNDTDHDEEVNRSTNNTIEPVIEEVQQYFNNGKTQDPPTNAANKEAMAETEIVFDAAEPNAAMLDSVGEKHVLTAEAPQLSRMMNVNLNKTDGHLVGTPIDKAQAKGNGNKFKFCSSSLKA